MVSFDEVNRTLDEIRPYLREDGGEVELVSVSSDGIVEVRLTGSCRACPLSEMTLRAGVERWLFIAHKDIKRVEKIR